MDISYIPFNFPSVSNIQCLFQTRIGGYSQNAYGGGNISFSTEDVHEHVLQNRVSLHRIIGYDFCELLQVHGCELIFNPSLTPLDKQPTIKADGQATDKPGLALLIKTADCQPILLCHKKGRHIMALHVGWRGNKNEFILSAIDQFCAQYALLPQDLLAVRGPSLGPQQAEFINFSTEWNDDFKPWYFEFDKTMDLWSLSRNQLQKAGLMPQCIFGLDMCTATMNDLFFSYRKEKLSGRQASAIWIEK